MSSLRDILEEYLALRRSLGFKLRKPERLLKNFLAAMENEGTDVITAGFTQHWLTQKAHCKPSWQQKHLTVVRIFARYCRAIDSRHEVPPPTLTPKPSRPSPYIYTPKEIECLVNAAHRLLADPLLPWTYASLFGLLAVTGARSGEVIALNDEDVDLQSGILFIRNAKFGKSRLIPLHESTRNALQAYVARRDACYPKPQTPSFLVCHRGKRLDYRRVVDVFHELSRRTGLRTADRRPRLHDLRHTFAVRTLIGWYRTGQNVEQKLPVLSTFLGHHQVSGTYWYLSACPELLELAVGRLEAAFEGLA